MKIATITETTELEKLLPLLSDIEQYYPDILGWYKEKFLHFPSLSNKALIAYNDNDEIIGFCLGDTPRPKGLGFFSDKYFCLIRT